MRDEPGGSCELCCNPSVCCSELGCHSLALPGLQQPGGNGSRGHSRCQGTACSHGAGGLPCFQLLNSIRQR